MLANAVASAADGLVVSFQSYVHLHGYNVTRKQAFVNDLIEQRDKMNSKTPHIKLNIIDVSVGDDIDEEISNKNRLII